MSHTENQISERVIKIIAESLSVDEKKVVPEASFTSDLGADSLDSVELMMELEEKFDIEIPDEKAQTMATVQDVINYVQEHSSVKEA